MGTKKISELVEISELVNDDLFPVVDTENDATKKIKLENLRKNVNTISIGEAMLYSSYISAAERNYFSKSERVVCYSFTMTVTGTWNSTTIFLHGLPRAKQATRFLGINTSNNTVLRFEVTTDGEIKNAYSSTTPTSGQLIEGQITYISID